ncbi:HlyD family type I secretion periplasmic adaptor subunit [Acidomonas methanolica]|uniref:HlyD family type I secretion periplasmic adaptor subunit n=1 Tax=Acidomonas methanolica TaxID=437 RepID=UPI00211A88BD|nr:HlyD family type I secretion periplasmic adaptor subunit [Acidomonas methanolica]MCQ9155008.1 HlyD family type I secretion periplasmic adaptor subunit [Acidomonas methanolica]
MSGSELLPPGQPDESGRDDAGGRAQPGGVPSRPRDPFAQEGMPLALLEFHSPSAAMVNLPPTPSAQRIIWLVAGLFTASFVAAGVFPINEVINAPGRLVSTGSTIVVQPLETSIIRSIDVHPGDFVKQGQIVAHLDPTISGADLTNMRDQKAAYLAEVTRLRDEADGKDYHPVLDDKASVDEGAAFQRRRQEYDAKIAQYDGQIASLQSELEGYLASAAMYQRRTQVASQVLEMRRRLQQQQVGSKLNTLGAEADLTESERNQVAAVKSANASRARLAATRAEKQNYIEAWKAEIYTELSKAQHNLDDATSNYEKARLRGNLVELRAPADAVVLTVSRLSVGSVATSAQQLLTMVPTGYGLELEAVLRGQDVGFVHIGDHTLIKFTTFPYDQFGGAEGSVRTISADAFGNQSTDDGLPTARDTAAQSSPDGPSLSGYYRVRVRIDRYTLHGVPNFFHPMPGLPATANIDVGKRTVLRYFFNRLIPAATNGMREPS